MLWQPSVLIGDEHTAARGCKVRWRRDFCLNLHIPRLRRAVSSGISGDGITRKNQASTGSIPTATETLAQFLVIDLWIAVHVEANKGNKVARFWWTSKLWRVVSLYIPPPTCRLAGGYIRLRKGAAVAKRRKALLCVDDNQSCLNTGKIILEDFG